MEKLKGDRGNISSSLEAESRLQWTMQQAKKANTKEIGQIKKSEA